jgi:WD repeat-containing protein 59
MMEEPTVESTIKSAFDSPTFNVDVEICVDSQYGDCGSATISPSGRDVAIAS